VLDLRVPLGVCVTNGVCLALGLFCDVGNLWSRPPGLDALYRARFSPGFGLRTTSPFGIISLDVGFNPLYRAYIQEQLWALQFSLGSV
jgi:outer membrane protein assembly factor BamA